MVEYEMTVAYACVRVEGSSKFIVTYDEESTASSSSDTICVYWLEEAPMETAA
jgi:hypothetical protein